MVMLLESPSVAVTQINVDVCEKSSDTEVILACQAGNTKAFDILMRRHRRAVYAILHSLAPDLASQHDDFAQEVMIRIYRGIKQLRNPAAFKSWVRQTATNLFYDELRRRPSLTPISLDTAYGDDDDREASGMDIADVNNQPDEVLERKEIMREVNEAISKLPDNYKDVIVLREFHGLAYDEIARITNAEVGTVKSRLSRARTRVQYALEGSRCA